MKKQTKLLVVVLAVVMLVSVFALAACGETSKFTTKRAYGLVHGKGYVGNATVEVDKDGSLVSAKLDEACFPSQVTLTAEDTAKLNEGEYGTVSGKHGDSTVYAKVKVGSIVFELDTTAKAYKVSGKTLEEYFADAAACEAYYTAVENNDIYVTVKGVETAGVITKADLLKTQNGYWTGVTTGAQGWGTNAMATCHYVMEYGFGATSFEKGDKFFTDNNGVSTGATWTDFQDYFNLLKAAFNK